MEWKLMKEKVRRKNQAKADKDTAETIAAMEKYYVIHTPIEQVRLMTEFPWNKNVSQTPLFHKYPDLFFH